MLELSRKFGAQGGKKAAMSMTPEERSARAKKAAKAAAEKRTAERLKREARTTRDPKTTNPKLAR